MGATTRKANGASRGKVESRRASKTGAGPGAEAWVALRKLVYPPPFLAIARELGLSPSTFAALHALEQPRTMGELASQLHCDNSNVTGIVDGLEARGLAERGPSPKDRRVKLVAITAEGRRVRARLVKSVEKPPAWLANLSPADQRTLRDLLQRAGQP
jgi:DNA-binding MarR family transcriptional regulator